MKTLLLSLILIFLIVAIFVICNIENATELEDQEMEL